MKQQDTYYLDRVIEDEKAVIRVYRPILTDEERARRLEEVKKAAAALLGGRYVP